MADILTDLESPDVYSNYGATDLISEFGDEDDLWGSDEIKLSDLLDPSFLVKFDADLGVGLYRADAVTIEVFYEVYSAQVELATLPPWFEESLQSGCIGMDNGAKKFVVVGQKGLMMVSDDGETWVEQESGVADTLRAIISTEQGVTAVGDNGTIISSEDTQNWVKQVSGTLETLIGVAYNFGGGNTVSVGTNGVIKERSSNDINWNTVR